MSENTTETDVTEAPTEPKAKREIPLEVQAALYVIGAIAGIGVFMAYLFFTGIIGFMVLVGLIVLVFFYMMTLDSLRWEKRAREREEEFEARMESYRR